MPGANIDAVAKAAQRMSNTKPDFLVLQALDIDVIDEAPIHHIYHSIDNLIHTTREAYKDSHIIISGLPFCKDNETNRIKGQVELYIKHKLAADYRICLLDNTDVKLTDKVHFTLRSKVALCGRLGRLAKPNAA